MIRQEVPQQKTIIATSAEEWDDKVNAVLRELLEDTRKEPTVDRTINGDRFEAVINYHIVVQKAEDAKDRALLNGVRHTCDECPFLARVEDRRIKHLTCDRGMRVATCRNDDACIWFYEEMERGRD